MEVACKMSPCAGAPTPMVAGISQNPKYARNSNCVRILDFWGSRSPWGSAQAQTGRACSESMSYIMRSSFGIHATPVITARTIFPKIRTQFELRAYFGFWRFPGPVGVDPSPYRSGLLRIDELQHAEFIWDPRHACHHR